VLDAVTGDRNYIAWNLEGYSNPKKLGKTLEAELQCKVIVNVKLWLLNVHPLRVSASSPMFVKAPPDSAHAGRPESSWLWSNGFGKHKCGSYIDFSSREGAQWWKDRIQDSLLSNGFSGL
jgi:alpha-glucosidase (family GH31 glycosyl hydrolase)